MKRFLMIVLCWLGHSASAQELHKQETLSSRYEVSMLFTGYADFEFIHYSLDRNLQVGVGTSVLGMLLNVIVYDSLPPAYGALTYFLSDRDVSTWYGQVLVPVQSLFSSEFLFPASLGYRWKFDDSSLSVGVMAMSTSLAVPSVSWGLSL